MERYKEITDLKEKQDVGMRTAMAAKAHRLASDLCLSTSSSVIEPDSLFLRIVSFELLLVSVEQSLRLLLLLRFSIFPENPNHDLSAIYKTLQDRSVDDKWITTEIIQEMNALIQDEAISPISEKELIDCLQKHRHSYSNIKYLQVSKEGKLNKNFDYFTGRERRILHCFALALTKLNDYGLGVLGVIVKPEASSEITQEDLELLKKRFLPADT